VRLNAPPKSSADFPARLSPLVRSRQARKPTATISRVETIMIVAIALTDGRGAALVAL
jgi:hypothetical protein